MGYWGSRGKALGVWVAALADLPASKRFGGDRDAGSSSLAPELNDLRLAREKKHGPTPRARHLIMGLMRIFV